MSIQFVNFVKVRFGMTETNQRRTGLEKFQNRRTNCARCEQSSLFARHFPPRLRAASSVGAHNRGARTTPFSAQAQEREERHGTRRSHGWLARGSAQRWDSRRRWPRAKHTPQKPSKLWLREARARARWTPEATAWRSGSAACTRSIPKIWRISRASRTR